MIFVQCDAVYVDPLGNRMHCDLKAGHKGSHQCGGSQIWIEWENEDDESILQDLPKEAER